MSCTRPILPGLQGQARPVNLLGSLLGGARSYRRCSFRHGSHSPAQLAEQRPHRAPAAHSCTAARGTAPRAHAAAVPAACRFHNSHHRQHPAWGREASSPLLQGRQQQRQCRTQAVIETDSLVPLGLDFLTFLAATVLVIPLFKSVKASPILGFLFSGIVLGQLG